MKKSTKVWLLISGILLVALGILCIVKPAATLFATAWIIGCFTLFSGISRLVFTFRTERFLFSGIHKFDKEVSKLNNNIKEMIE